MLITLSGLDGRRTGAMAEWLRQELERGPRPAVVLHLNEQVGIYAGLRALRRRLGGGPASRDAARSRRGRVRDALLWSRPLRRAVYLVDLLIFLVYRAVLEQVGGRVLIMDRYFYDTLVDVAGGRLRGWLRLFAWMTPRPDLPVLLEMCPEDAVTRPGPAAVARLRDRDDGYRRVFRRVPAPLRLHGRDLDAARRLLGRAVRAHLAYGADHAS